MLLIFYLFPIYPLFSNNLHIFVLSIEHTSKKLEMCHRRVFYYMIRWPFLLLYTQLSPCFYERYRAQSTRHFPEEH